MGQKLYTPFDLNLSSSLHSPLSFNSGSWLKIKSASYTLRSTVLDSLPKSLKDKTGEIPGRFLL